MDPYSLDQCNVKTLDYTIFVNMIGNIMLTLINHKIPTCKEQQLCGFQLPKLVEDSGIEPLTSCVQGRRSPI